MSKLGGLITFAMQDYLPSADRVFLRAQLEEVVPLRWFRKADAALSLNVFLSSNSFFCKVSKPHWVYFGVASSYFWNSTRLHFTNQTIFVEIENCCREHQVTGNWLQNRVGSTTTTSKWPKELNDFFNAVPPCHQAFELSWDIFVAPHQSARVSCSTSPLGNNQWPSAQILCAHTVESLG